MCAIRDITNYFVNVSEEFRFERASDENISVNPAPSLARVQQRASWQGNQPSNQRSETVDSSDSNGEIELQNKKKHKVRPDNTSSVFYTPETPTTEQLKEVRPRKRLRFVETGTSSPLATNLKGLTKTQLIDLLTSLSEKHSGIDKEIMDLMPEPDLSELEERLIYLKRNIYKSFPYSRRISNRDAFSFRRVSTHLHAFKKECLAHGRNLVLSQQWKAAIDYVLKAWKYVDEMPDWDNPSHNSSKEQCFKSLAVQCRTSLQKSAFTKDEYLAIQRRLLEAHEANSHIAPCLSEIAKILNDL